MISRILLLPLLAIATSVCVWWGYSEHDHGLALENRAVFAEKQLAITQADNERLRALVAGYEKAKRQARQVVQRKEIEQTTARIRGLPFKTPVVYDVLTRDGIKKVLAKKLSEQYSDAEFERARLGYVALGLIPADYPLKQRYIDLLSEQVAAFYDQHSHRLYMFEDASLDSLQNRIILSHELTHALQDQYFKLDTLPLETKDNDDRAVAASALVEGDATLEMNQFSLEGLSWNAVARDFSTLFSQNLEQLQAAPRYLREGLLFPYVEGLRFCTELFLKDGFQGVSSAFARPPSSSSQILHPERYLAGDQPVAVPWADTTALGEKPVADNVLGELGLRILLTDWTDTGTASAATQGWRGDRYLVFAEGKALVWRTYWASPESAVRFREATNKMLVKRYGADWASFPAAGRSIKVTVAGNAVTLIDASDERWARALNEKFTR